MNSFVLKLIAIITMTFDHAGDVFIKHFSWLNYIGRIAFPLFAFQISEGYIHTKNKKNYLIRLLALAIVSQFPFMLFRSTYTSGFALNIFATLFIGLIAIIGYEECSIRINKWIGLLLVISLASTANFLKTDYGAWGVLVIFVFHIFKDNIKYRDLAYIALVLFRYLPNIIYYNFAYQYILLCIGTLIPLLFIHFYNGKKGLDTKYILYGYYPVHLMVLYVLDVVL